jgi:serine/threonine protein kinase
LNHPNILAVFQVGAYEGAPYLVSELLEGETLREPIKRRRLPVRKAIDYGMQITQGLASETGLLIPSVFRELSLRASELCACDIAGPARIT